MMKDKELANEIEDLIEDLETEVGRLVEQNSQLHNDNMRLKDEVDSLWRMMDEMTKQDIESWTSVMEELNMDVVARALMVVKKKADC